MEYTAKHSGQHDFWKFYIGQSLSTFGSTFTGFALPLFVYQLTKSPAALALTFAADRLPYPLIGVFAGA